MSSPFKLKKNSENRLLNSWTLSFSQPHKSPPVAHLKLFRFKTFNMDFVCFIFKLDPDRVWPSCVNCVGRNRMRFEIESFEVTNFVLTSLYCCFSKFHHCPSLWPIFFFLYAALLINKETHFLRSPQMICSFTSHLNQPFTWEVTNSEPFITCTVDLIHLKPLT